MSEVLHAGLWGGLIAPLVSAVFYLRRNPVGPAPYATLGVALLVVIAMAFSSGYRNDVVNLNDLAALPVAEGRVMPIDSLARSLLFGMAERQTVKLGDDKVNSY